MAHADQETCESSWLTPHGAPTFTDDCVSEAASIDRALAEALGRFAQDQQLVHVAGPSCGQIRAIY